MSWKQKADWKSLEMDTLWSIHIPFVGYLHLRRYTWAGGKKLTIET